MVCADFVREMVAGGVTEASAGWIWDQFQPYYFKPLTPYPGDRIYGDLKIDGDDISEMALVYEKTFGGWFGDNPIDCSPDPTLMELALALHKAAF